MQQNLEFSHLTFHEVLGRGGFSQVIRVTFKTHMGQTEVAAKCVAVDDIRGEIDIMKRIDHPNVVKFYGDMDAPMNQKILLLEYTPFGTVHDYLERQSGPTRPDLLLKWSKESALAIEYLHKHKILHRDIKPSNSLLFEDNLLKLSDLGLARELSKSMAISSAKGTPLYMAPEIHRDNHFCFGSDMYAYGMLVLVIATGKPPFDGQETAHVVYMVGTTFMTPKIPTNLSEPIAELVWRCWSPSPQYRPTASEAVNVISGASAESHATLSQGQAALTEAHSVQQWRIVKEFGKEEDGQGEFKMARGIAVCDNNDIVVDDNTLHRVYLFSKDGTYKFTLVSPKGNPQVELLFPCDVAVTSQGHIAVVETCTDPEVSKYVKVFDVSGTYLHSFPTVADDETYTEIASASIVVASDGKILVGDMGRKCVTIHAGSDGGLIQKVNLNIQPHFLATNSHHQIFVCDWKARKVIGVDYDSNVLFVLNSFMVDGETGMPQGLTCGDDHTLYITVVKLNESTGGGFNNTGHIHQYSPSGRFMRCLIKGLYYPRGITWHNGGLYVANDLSVLILGTSSSQ